MFDVVLYEPEIAPNTGSIIRLCANTGCRLHLIEPLGFTLDDRRLRRAGLDYHEYAQLQVHADLAHCQAALAGAPLWACTTRGTTALDAAAFAPGDTLWFGPETRGLPAALLAAQAPERCLRIPMRPASRSLNLANAVAVVVYEAWRQQGYAGGE